MAKRNGGDTPAAVEARAKAREEGVLALTGKTPEAGSALLTGQRIIISVAVKGLENFRGLDLNTAAALTV